MDIIDDAVIAACLLHDVVEDCEIGLDELPVGDEAKELVRLLTKEDTKGKNRDEVMIAYYNQIATNPKAALIKCLDRCNNLTTMSWGLSRDRIYQYIIETEKYFPRLLKVVKVEPEYIIYTIIHDHYRRLFSNSSANEPYYLQYKIKNRHTDL